MTRHRFVVALALRAVLCAAALVTLVLAPHLAPPPSATAALRGAEPVAAAPTLPFLRIALALLLVGGLAAELHRRRAWH